MNEKIQWLEWNPASFEKARKENKPILLYITAVWCHWCHRFRDDTFQKEEIVLIVNENFIPIKVDTDKRPDINSRFNMGGWPSYVFLTPQGATMHGGTYSPPTEFKFILEQVLQFFSQSQNSLNEKFSQVLTQSSTPKSKTQTSNQQLIDSAFQDLKNSFDSEFGGFGFQPKFPMPDALKLLLLQYRFTKNEELILMLEKTLNAMASTGLFDQIEGGFFVTLFRETGIALILKKCRKTILNFYGFIVKH